MEPAATRRREMKIDPDPNADELQGLASKLGWDLGGLGLLVAGSLLFLGILGSRRVV